MKNYLPNRGRLLVEVIPVEAIKNGIQLPDTALEALAKRRAKILKVGAPEFLPNGTQVPHTFHNGQIVVLSVYTQPEHIMDDVFAVRFSEVLATELEEN